MTYTEAAELLRRQDSILILTHRRPDGDTIGCAVGLCAALRELGKTAWLLPNADATALFTPYLEGYLAPDGFSPAFVVSVDIAGRGLFPENARCWLEKGVDLAIDHHGSNEGFGKENCVDPGRAACGELIYDIIRQWGPVSPHRRPASVPGRVHRHRLLCVQQHHLRHPPGGRRPAGHRHRLPERQQAAFPHQEL